jgi:ATP-binding cassette, subfamily B, bacterial PglK
MDLLSQLWGLFNRRERWQVSALFVAMMIRAAVTTVGVASIMPFMSVVAEPEKARTNPYLAWAFDWFGFSDVNVFMMALGLAVIGTILISNGVSALTTYGMVRFNWGMCHRLSMRLLEGYLRQPYSFFVQRNSASLHKTLLSEINVVIISVVKPVLDIGSRALVVVFLLVLIVAIDPRLAAISVAVLGGAYGTLYMMIKRKQRRLGKERVRANRERFKTAGEAFGGIKDVKVLQQEIAFVDRFRPASWRFARTNASNAMISQLPNYLLDTIAFGGIILVVLYFLGRGEGVVEILPVISLYAFAGYRLMPELKVLFSDFAKIRFNRAALDDFLEDYQDMSVELKPQSSEVMPFEKEIVLDDVFFRYPQADTNALDGITLRIRQNETIGLVGPSGSGKTTLVDVLLGLYLPNAGVIRIDDLPVTEANVRAWQHNIGYVPQVIFLTDDTIAANIAFGAGRKEIDMARVEKAARIAHLHEFVDNLPQRYNTMVGERGVRLSGGQRQRIGIARALYHDPAVLIMDEATSALDGATENAVMDAIQELTGQKTVILIAHRLTTVENCEIIYMIADGQVVGQGTYKELFSANREFRMYAGVH